MAQHCPFCKARLWSGPWLASGGRLKCPRCGNEFRPTAPWSLVRVLFLLVLALATALIFVLPGRSVWFLALVVVAAIVVWYLPRWIDFQHLSENMTASEGPMDPERMKLQLEDRDWNDQLERNQDLTRFRSVVVLLLFLTIALVVILQFTGA